MISLISLLLLTPSIRVNDVADPVSAGADPHFFGGRTVAGLKAWLGT